MSTTKTQSITVQDLAEREVEIDCGTLREAGWILKEDAPFHCTCDPEGAYDNGMSAAREEFDATAHRVMEDWHNEHHSGVVRFCYESPCAELRKAAGE